MSSKGLCTVYLMTVLFSCSVKEDRSDCPCYLEVDLSQTDAAYVRLNAWCGMASVFSESVPRSRRDDFHEYRVPRGQVLLSAYRETPGLFLNGNVLAITEGSQMDSLFACTTRVDTDAEVVHETIRLQKNFTTVSVIFEDEADVHDGIRYLRGRSGRPPRRLPDGGVRDGCRGECADADADVRTVFLHSRKGR